MIKLIAYFRHRPITPTSFDNRPKERKLSILILKKFFRLVFNALMLIVIFQEVQMKFQRETQKQQRLSH